MPDMTLTDPEYCFDMNYDCFLIKFEADLVPRNWLLGSECVSECAPDSDTGNVIVAHGQCTPCFGLCLPTLRVIVSMVS